MYNSLTSPIESLNNSLKTQSCASTVIWTYKITPPAHTLETNSRNGLRQTTTDHLRIRNDNLISTAQECVYLLMLRPLKHYLLDLNPQEGPRCLVNRATLRSRETIKKFTAKLTPVISAVCSKHRLLRTGQIGGKPPSKEDLVRRIHEPDESLFDKNLLASVTAKPPRTTGRHLSCRISRAWQRHPTGLLVSTPSPVKTTSERESNIVRFR